MSADRMSPAGKVATRFFKAADDQENTLRYLTLKDDAFRRAPWALHDFSSRDLIERDALIVLMSDKSAPDSPLPVAGLHVVIDGAGMARLQGLVADHTVLRHGFGKAAVCEALCYARDVLRAERAELVVRVQAGHPNPAAFPLFREIGFLPEGEMAVTISGLPCDAHLAATADGDGKYRVERMSLNLAGWRFQPKESA